MQGLLIRNPNEFNILETHGLLYLLRHQRRTEGLDYLKDYETRRPIHKIRITLVNLMNKKDFLKVADKYIHRSGHDNPMEWIESFQYGSNKHSRVWLYRIERVNIK